MNSKPYLPKQSFITGALILSLAGFLSQFLGVFSKIFLLWLIGEEGVGIYNFPYPFFAIILSFSSVGFNIAISKLVAEAIGEGQEEKALTIFNQGRKISITFGFLGTIFLAVLAYPMAHFVHQDARAFFSYLSLAPTAFLTSFQATYRGYFQGLQNVKPNAYSQIIEQICRIITMLLLAWLLLPLGLTYGAAGATFGAAVGALGASFYLSVLYKNHTKSLNRTIAKQRQNLQKEILRHAIPISFAGIGLPAFLLADSLLIANRLQKIGYAFSDATAAYGMFANNAMSLITIPTIVTGSLFVTLIPAIAEAKAAGLNKRINSLSQKALLITIMFALPAGLGLQSVAYELASVLRMSEATARVLQPLAFALPFIALQQVSSGILQGMGITILPVINMLLGAATKLGGNYFLIPKFGINGAAYATILGFTVASFLNLARVYKEQKDIRKILGQSLIYAFSAFIMNWVLNFLAVKTVNLSALLSLSLKSLSGVLVYFGTVVVLNVLKSLSIPQKG